jgi:hypothetical protein
MEPSLRRRSSSAGTHTPLAPQVYSTARHRIEHQIRGIKVPLRCQPRCPPSAESSFALLRCYLSRGGIECHLEGHYPFFVAHTSSCANPKSSTRLRLRYSSWSLQVAASPCWMRDLPDVISASLSLDAWTRIPLACRSAHARYSLPQHRPSPPGTRVGMPEWSAQRLLSGPVFRDDSHSLDVQASKFACHPGRSHRCGSKTARQPWRLHPSRTYVVTFIRIGHASRPNRAIDDRGLSPH